jgi:hypothetical protein
MRLDHYAKISKNNIHLASILYSILSTVVLTLILAAIISRDLRIDFSKIEILNIRRK